jgi:cytidyltransferase-like protein
MKDKAVIVSGYFNPIHKGHIEYFHMAKKIADTLIVIVNSDYQRNLKGSKEFMLENERALIVSELEVVDQVVIAIDKDRTVSRTIAKIFNENCNVYDLSFANGGDQNNETIPEAKVCKELGVNLVDGLGEKIQSSSWLLNSNDEN